MSTPKAYKRTFYLPAAGSCAFGAHLHVPRGVPVRVLYAQAAPKHDLRCLLHTIYVFLSYASRKHC